MDETEFHTTADAALEALESSLEADFEAELVSGILTVETEAGTFVLNKHAPTKQLWLSSPLSGAARFEYKDGWKHAVTGEVLEVFLKRELGISL